MIYFWFKSYSWMEFSKDWFNFVKITNLNVDPLPTYDFNSILSEGPNKDTSYWLIVNPKPTPCLLLFPISYVLYNLKRFFYISSGIPYPVSETEISIRSF